MEKNVEPLNDSEITRLNKAAGKRWLTHWECQSLFATITDLKEKLAEAIRAGQKMHDQAEAAGLANIGLEQENKRLREALNELASAKALKEVRSIVAGWNGEGSPDGPYERHPAKLGATLKTNCGAIYELDEAMTKAAAALSHKEGG